MSNDRIQPTDKMECTESCPSYGPSGHCMECGLNPHPVEHPFEHTGGVSNCQPALDAIKASYKAKMDRPTKQEYATLNGHNPAFGLQVNEFLAAGWRLHGTTDSEWDEERWFYTQAMVRDVPAEITVDVPIGDFVTDSKLAHRMNESGLTVPVTVKTED